MPRAPVAPDTGSVGSTDWDDLARQRDRETRAEAPRRVAANSRSSATRRRFYAYLLDGVLPLVVLVLATRFLPLYGAFAAGWLVYLAWSAFAWRRGQSPGKQLMGMYVVHDGERATWKRMCARELLAKSVVYFACALLAPLTFGVSLLFYFFFLLTNHQRQQLWDLVVATTVEEETWGY
jgi:uncharacterized RDD family membrane protein YckC